MPAAIAVQRHQRQATLKAEFLPPHASYSATRCFASSRLRRRCLTGTTVAWHSSISSVQQGSGAGERWVAQTHRQSRDSSSDAKKNSCKPWRKVMWCLGRITAEYRRRMYGLLELYGRPYNPREPVVCVDEKSKQLLQQTRSPIAPKPGQCPKEDYEYKRAGTRNTFMAVEASGEDLRNGTNCSCSVRQSQYRFPKGLLWM